VASGLRAVFVILAAAGVAFLLRKLVSRLRFHIVRIAEQHEGHADPEVAKRAATVSAVVKTVITVLVVLVASGMVLRELGFDIGPLIAGAGVAGIAIGLGSQHVFKDVLNGVLLLVDDQLRVGDIAIVNGVGGVVEQLNLRTTVLRDAEGTVHYFQNGNITSLANRTRDYSIYVFDLGLSYSADMDRAMEVLRRVDGELRREDAQTASYIAGEMEVWGVDQFTANGVLLKARIKTIPGKQWDVGREMNRRIKLAFEAAGIEFQTKLAKIRISQDDELALRELIREVATQVAVEKQSQAKG
jgi:small conductance mechanosensitive channel